MVSAVEVVKRDDRANDRGPRERDIIVTTKPLVCDGRTIPAGSRGMVVDVADVAGTRYFEVEFLLPFHCIASMDASQVP